MSNTWPTLKTLIVEITDKFITDMLAIGEEYEAQHPEAHVPYYMRKSKEVAYNLLADPREACQIFKKLLKSRMTELAKAEGFTNPDEVKFEAVSSMRTFGPGEYAKPHNHRSVDYVAVLWLSLFQSGDKRLIRSAYSSWLNLLWQQSVLGAICWQRAKPKLTSSRKLLKKA